MIAPAEFGTVRQLETAAVLVAGNPAKRLGAQFELAPMLRQLFCPH